MLKNKQSFEIFSNIQHVGEESSYGRVKHKYDDLQDEINSLGNDGSTDEDSSSKRNESIMNNMPIHQNISVYNSHSENLHQNGRILNIPTLKNRLTYQFSTDEKVMDPGNKKYEIQKILKNDERVKERQKCRNTISVMSSSENDQLFPVSHSAIDRCEEFNEIHSLNGAHVIEKSKSKSYKSRRKCYTPRRRQKQQERDDDEKLVEKEVKKYLLKIPDIQSIIKNSAEESAPELEPCQELGAVSGSTFNQEFEGSLLENSGEVQEDSLTHHAQDFESTDIKIKELRSNENVEMELDLNSGKKKKTWKPKERVACEMCSKTFGRPSDLRRQMVLHTGEKNHKCDECKKVFAQRYHLVRHVKNVHKKDIENLVCGMCNETFNSEYLLLRHVKRHGVMTFACEICRKEYKTKRQMMEHILSQHVGMKPFKCEQCDKVFARKYHLERHVMIHTGIKEFQCEYCGKEFGTKGNLLAHVKRVHLKIKEYSCGVCQKGFFSPKDLQTHLKTHTGEKPHECDICHKKFTEKINMEWHLRIHSGERPYQCEFCLKSYTRMPHLIRHKKEGLCRRMIRSENGSLTDDTDEEHKFGNAQRNSPMDFIDDSVNIAAFYFYKWFNKTKRRIKSDLNIDDKNENGIQLRLTGNENKSKNENNEIDNDYDIDNDGEHHNIQNNKESIFHQYSVSDGNV